METHPLASVQGYDSELGVPSPGKQDPVSTEDSSNKNDIGWRSRLNELWIAELSAWLVAALCLAAICIILNAFDEQPIPSWHYGITVNTLVAIFSTVSKLLLLIPVAEGLSQLKWLWFAAEKNPEGREMIGFQHIDKASRGAFGSIFVIWKARFWPIVSSGALLMVLALATEPITQQAVGYETRSINLTATDTAQSFRTSRYADSDDNDQGPAARYGISMSMAAAISSGLFYSGNATLPEVTASCSTGNCTWEDYETLGICAEVANITSLLNNTSGKVDINGYLNFLPNGVGIHIVEGGDLGGLMFMASANTSYPSIAFPEMSLPVADFFLIAATKEQGMNLGAFAMEIVMFFCVQKLRTSVISGVQSSFMSSWSANFTPAPIIFDDYTTTVKGEQYNVSAQAAGYVQAYSDDLFQGYFGQSADGTGPPYASDAVRSFVNARNNPPYDIAAISGVVANLATSMSNSIRQAPGSNSPAVGVASTVVTIVKVQWPWLSLLAFLILASLLFLIVIIALSMRAKVNAWKSSSIAVLVAKPSPDGDSVRGMTRSHQLDKYAEQTAMKLVQKGDAWRLEVVVPSAITELQYVARPKHPEQD